MLGFKENAREIEESVQRAELANQKIEADMAADRANGYLAGPDVVDWKKKQSKLVESFLSKLTEETFDVTNGVVAALPKYKMAREWIEATRGELQSRKSFVEFPSELIKAGKLNTEPLSSLSSRRSYVYKGVLHSSDEIVPLLVETQDPPFETSKGKTVYELRDNNNGKIVFYVLTGNALRIATEDGVVVERMRGYEGHKAKLARLAAEEAERKRLEEIERMKREQEAEDARQASQLDKLKSLPSEKFAKLMKLING